jgi:hypothetical protein
MTLILTRLSIANLLLLLVTCGTGLLPATRQSAPGPDASPYDWHAYLGVLSALSTLALHCLVFIYLLGTGRLIKEVAIAYRIPDAPLPRLTRDLKRRTFPVALLAMLVPIATAAAGAGARFREWPWQVHLALALATLLVNAWALVVERRNVGINVGVLDEVFREIDRIRAEHGLPSNAEALRQEGQ